MQKSAPDVFKNIMCSKPFRSQKLKKILDSHIMKELKTSVFVSPEIYAHIVYKSYIKAAHCQYCSQFFFHKRHGILRATLSSDR